MCNTLKWGGEIIGSWVSWADLFLAEMYFSPCILFRPYNVILDIRFDTQLRICTIYLFIYFNNGTSFKRDICAEARGRRGPRRDLSSVAISLPPARTSRGPFDDMRGWKHRPARSTIQPGNHGASSFSSRLQMKSKRPWSNRGPAARLRELRIRAHIRDGEKGRIVLRTALEKRRPSAVFVKKKKETCNDRNE